MTSADAVKTTFERAEPILSVKSMAISLAYWGGLEDVAALFAEYRVAGARIRIPPVNHPWAYEMQVEDPDGHVLRFGSEPRADLPAS